MSLGVEWIVDAFRCPADLLRSPLILRAVCEDVVEAVGLRVVGDPQWRQFPGPGGVTGLYLLSESHLACHTWPEHGTATFNLFCCRPRPEFAWERRLRDALRAEVVQVRTVTRGVLLPSDSHPVNGAWVESHAPEAGVPSDKPRRDA